MFVNDEQLITKLGICGLWYEDALATGTAPSYVFLLWWTA